MLFRHYGEYPEFTSKWRDLEVGKKLDQSDNGDVGDFFDEKNPSPTSQIGHQHRRVVNIKRLKYPSPTSI